MLNQAQALTREYAMLTPGSHILCAVSGGADSVCLLHWLKGRAAEDGFTLTDGSVVNISRPYWQTARGVYACYMTQSRDEPHLERPQPAQLGGREAWR